MLFNSTMQTYPVFGKLWLRKNLQFKIPRPPKIEEDLIFPFVGNVVVVGFLIFRDVMSVAGSQ